MTVKEREAWTAIYRLYDEFAPALRDAAALDDDNATAGKVFCDALESVRELYDGLDDGGKLLLLAGYDILDETFKAAKKRHLERVQATAAGNNRTGDEPAKITA